VLLLELRLLLRTKAPWLAAALMIVVLAGAILNRAPQRAESGQFVLPSLPTRLLSDGESANLPQRFTVRTARFAPFYRTVGTRILGGFFPETSAVNPSASLAGGFDLAFVAAYFYPLLILALTCNIASADRESCVLALIQSQPVRLRDWLARRALVRGGFLFVFAVLLPALAVGTIVAGSWARIALWILALTAYCAFWFALAIGISLRTPSAAPGFVIGASSWLALVILVPAAINLLTPLLAPATSTISYVNAERAASLAINPRIDAATTAVIRYGTVPLDLLGPSAASLSRPELQRALLDKRRTMFEEQLAPVLQTLDTDEQRLDRAIAVLRYLSPALVFESILDDLAGTGRPRWREFVAQVDTHIRRGRATPFTFSEESTAGLLRRIGPRMIAVLILPCIIWGAAALWNPSCATCD
jgi:ABC-2 type transport system permease protein